jgi:hypothetical protein
MMMSFGAVGARVAQRGSGDSKCAGLMMTSTVSRAATCFKSLHKLQPD